VYRIGLITSLSINNIYKELKNRFQPPLLEAFTKYNNTRYLIDNYRSRQSITEYIASLKATTKAYGQGPIEGDNVKFSLVI
jgi:hypothetical protein